MAKVDLEDLFFDFLEATKEFVPESDHIQMCLEILRHLEDQGYNVKKFYGQDEVVDEALTDLHPELDEFYEEDDFE